MITVENLTKHYGPKVGVEDVSFSIAKGEIVGLLGPNGAGKSTIMKMLAGYIRPTSGRMEIDGIDVEQSPREASARIGFAPEIPALYSEMTVKDFLGFVTKIRGVPRPDRAAHLRQVTELSGLEGVAGRLIKNLSKGYRQRVGLAQALVGFPPVLILDELTAGMDPKQISGVRDLIKSLSEKHTIILSSHILSEIQATCERVVIINKGRVAASGSLGQLGRREGEDSFIVRLKAPRDTAKSLLKGVGGIASVQRLAQDDGDSFLAVGGKTAREELFQAAAKAGTPILELRSASASLEDVFLQLTADGGGEEEKA